MDQKRNFTMLLGKRSPNDVGVYCSWLWGSVVGVVVAGTVGGLWAGSAFSSTSNNACPGGFTCVQSSA
jgi:hypothetical protein